MTATERRFSTGLPFLDRKIGGGFVPGDLLALTAPPASQAELLVAQFLSARRTTYLSTVREVEEIRAWADATTTAEGLTVQTTTPEALLDDPDDALDSLEPESFLVIDTVDGLETAPRDRYLEFTTRLKRRLRETDSVGVLYCTDQHDNPPRRGLTLNRADTVWQLEVLVLSREIKSRLLITKSRNGWALTEPIPLLLTDRVQVDTSRRIS